MQKLKKKIYKLVSHAYEIFYQVPMTDWNV